MNIHHKISEAKKSTMKNIFITGIAGMLGSNLAFLLRDKYNIYGIDKNTVNIKNINCEHGSALDNLTVENIIVTNKIDVFIHCAALVNVDLCEKKPDYAEIVNYQMVDNLRKICKKHNTKFVFISTDAVYKGEHVVLNKETDEIAPINVYAKTKLMAEEKVLEDEDALIIRTNMYGFNYRDKNSFSEWVVQALNSDETLNMFNDVYFSPILVNNLVKIIELAINKNLKGIYNIGSKNRIDKYSIGLKIKDVFNLHGVINSITVSNFNFTAPRTKNMGLDCSKIERDLNIVLNTVDQDLLEYKLLADERYPQKLKLGE